MERRARHESATGSRTAADWLIFCAVAGLGAALVVAGRILTGIRTDGLSFASLGDLSALAGIAAAGLGLGLLAWLALGTFLALCAAVLLRLGRQGAALAAGRFAPGFLRRLTAAVVGVQLLAGAGSAGALAPAESTRAAVRYSDSGLSGVVDPPPSAAPKPGQEATDPDPPSPLWRPAPPVDSPGLLARIGPQDGRAGDERTVAVRSGDDLWSLAAGRLGPLATDADIAREWPRWYELNRGVIGPDPNLLHPGLVLVIPPPA